MRKTDDFSSVFAFRRSLRRGPFQLFYRPNTLTTARMGVVVGKRFVRSAVARNRIKRVVREVFRLNRLELPCVDMVVRIAATPKPDVRLGDDLRWLLQRLGKDQRP